jgi:DivIVA domain-containing protein
MDLTPRLLTEVEFKEQWRGYSPTEVDRFLAGVATAVGELQQRHHEAVDRAMSAEQKLLERTDDDEVRRTLVLAQRTAASAVEEASAEAMRIVEEARRHAADVEAELAERRRVEVNELADRRAELQADIDALEAFLRQQRERLRAELTNQLATLDSPSFGGERPGTSGIEAMPVPAPEPFVPRPPTEEELAQARDDLIDALRQAGIEHVAPPVDDEPEPDREPESFVDPTSPAVATPTPTLYDADDESGELDLRGAEATQAFDVVSALDDDSLLWAGSDAIGENEVVVAEAPEAVEDDPFLAELRRAVTDDTPLGPRDDDERHTAFSPEEDSVPSGRFRLRRGR